MVEERKKNAACPCRRVKCARHGDCAACRAHHHGLGQKTTCERNREKGKKSE